MADEPDQTVAEVVARLGTVFATFDHRTQDSGNISYGVRRPDGQRIFVKTAGHPAPSPGGIPYAARVAGVRRAAEVQREVTHPALVPMLEAGDCSDGVVVIYEWFTGELLRSPADRRDDPAEAGSRFRLLPVPSIVAALDAIIDLHVVLDRAGWTSGDLYDGCLMYDFDSHQIRLMDLECYRRGAYVNDVGRLPGSSRFMAPEEYVLGAQIDARTTVFTLAKLAEWFLVRHEPGPAVRDVIARGRATAPGDRHLTLAAFQRDWRAATG